MQIQKNKLKLIFVFVLFLLPVSIYAEQVSVNIVLGRFFKSNIDSLVFKPTPSIYIFKSSDIRNSGNTFVPNPLGGLKPIGPLNLIQMPANVLINISNFVFDEVNR